MGTARTVEAEGRVVLQGSVIMGAEEEESSTGRVWTAGFYHVTTRFATYVPFISLIYPLFSVHGKPRIQNQ
jgi:hypothetical protein